MPAAAGPAGSLPLTGSDDVSLALIGAALVALGLVLVTGQRRLMAAGPIGRATLMTAHGQIRNGATSSPRRWVGGAARTTGTTLMAVPGSA